jgi:glycosyltransferase involved in cell wall biosynthesis
LRVAIVHDWLVTNGGAEKVLKNIIELYPKADIFALVDFLNRRERDNILLGKSTHTSFIQKLPFAKKRFRNYLPLFPKAIESFDFSGYDLIISSSWAVAKGVKRGKNQIHISYCHTPIRYAWDLYSEYVSNLKQPKKFLVQKSLEYIRWWDLKTVNRVDYFIANSKFVQKRIKKTYNRDSKVIYPPIEIDRFTLYENKEDFYITASRLVPYKKTKLIVEAFNKMPSRELIVIGTGEELKSIRDIAKSNIKVLGYQKDEVLIEYMQKAKAFIYSAIEDFGIVPIEAVACGTPVIALNRGGTAETILDNINGIHFQEQRVSDIMEAIDRFETMEFDPQKVSKSAKKFATDRFKGEIKKYIIASFATFRAFL